MLNPSPILFSSDDDDDDKETRVFNHLDKERREGFHRDVSITHTRAHAHTRMRALEQT